MIIGGRRAFVLLFAGDIVVFVLSLYLTLALRYFALPTPAVLAPYVLPFTFLFLFWVLVFYSSGLYGKRLLLFPSRVPDALLKTQLANIIFAALFFFLIPVFGIAPKTILFLYLLISLALIFLWRLTLFPVLLPHREREKAVLLAEGKEAEELFTEVNGNSRYAIEFTARAENPRASLTVADEAHSARGTKGENVAFEDLYEEVFDRIPLSKLGTEWFEEHAAPDSFWYTVLKRCVDVVGGIFMGMITVIITPLIFLANLFESPGPLFIAQDRFGRGGIRITVYKFRSMTKNLTASGEWVREGNNRVTVVGTLLRMTSLDEFPQFVNVLKGDLSLIGPRSDIRGLGERLMEALPYYEARYRVLPGITGWAQINQQYEPGNVSPQSIEETKVRLAYDFYYLKHRSFGLDLIIALKTIKRMFFRLSSW